MSTPTMHQGQTRKIRFQPPVARSLKAAIVLLVCIGAGATGIGSAFAATANTSGTVQPDSTSAAQPTPGSIGLPFAMPSKATLQASAHKVFAHYIPSLPISLDNQPATSDYYALNYLAPAGEGDKHVAYGGFLRDRPLGRPVLSGDWQLQDMETEVRQAISVGIDGFAVDILQVPGKGGDRMWTSTITLLQAAAAVDPNFKIMLTPDMNSARDATAAQWASALATLAAYPAAYRLADARLVVSPFLAEAHTPAWYTSLFHTLSADHGISTAFVPVFLDDQKYAASYASISYGMGNWGARNPTSNNADVTYSTSPVGRAENVKAMGKIWMQPVSVQDERPYSGIFDEAENTRNLRNTWKIALDSGADWVNMTTWNDYSEGSSFAPSQKHGWTYLDINAYYLAQFKTGTAPKITRDAVYLTHRTQKVAAPVSGPQTRFVQLRAGSSPARDTVEALSFLTAPATVSIKVGSTTTSCAVAAGVSTCTAPLASGQVAVSVVRSGVTVASLNDPYSVTATPYTQDLQYVAAGSMSSFGTGTNSVVGPGTDPVVGRTEPVVGGTAKQVMTLTPTADTYANAGAPKANFGTSWSLFSRATIGSISYLRFAIPAAPSGKVLTSAVLQVTTTSGKSAGTRQAQAVSIAGNSWNESTLTWNNRPALSTRLGSLASAPRSNTAYRVKLLTGGIPAGTDLTLATSGSGTDLLGVWSSNHSSPRLRPQLVLTYQ